MLINISSESKVSYIYSESEDDKKRFPYWSNTYFDGVSRSATGMKFPLVSEATLIEYVYVEKC